MRDFTEPSVDLNKGFYFDEDEDMDLKQTPDPMMEGLDLNMLTLDSAKKRSESDSDARMFKMNFLIKGQASEKTVDLILNEKSTLKKLTSILKKDSKNQKKRSVAKKVQIVDAVDKAANMNICKLCCAHFSKRSSLVVHMEECMREYTDFAFNIPKMKQGC